MTQLKVKYEELLEHVVCNLCSSDDFKIIYPAQYNKANPQHILDTFRSSGDEQLLDQMVECKKCGLKYLTPRLKQNIIIDGYSSGSDETFISQAKALEKTFSKCLDFVEQYAPNRGRILDVGTAGGSFLYVARNRGWDVAGCEPNKWLSEWSMKNYGLTIQAGTIFDMNLKDNSFDAVTLWDVLEHTTDPKKVLQECRRVLKPGGVIVVNYPDIESFVAKAMGKKWVFLLTIHLYYFGPKTLKKMLEDVGYEVLKKKKHWQSLELDYILFRMSAFIPVLPGFFRKVFKTLGMGGLHVPYWVGQSLMLAKKK